MKEVGAIIGSAQKFLIANGVSEQEPIAFREQIVETIKLAKTQDGEKTKVAIMVLKSQIESLINKTTT
jgi:hypothetical protein